MNDENDGAPDAKTATQSKKPAKPALSTEKRVRLLGEAVGKAVMENKINALHKLFAPWLQAEVSAKALKKIFDTANEDLPEPADFELIPNDVKLDDLRDQQAAVDRETEDGEPMTLATWDGELTGPYTFPIQDAISDENFRQALAIQFSPDDEEDEIDSCYALYLIVVEVEGEMRVGYLEVGEEQ